MSRLNAIGFAGAVAGLLIAATVAVPVGAECEDPFVADPVQEEGGIGGSGRSGGVGGTGRSGGIGGTGHSEAGADENSGMGGTGVLGTLRGEGVLCVAGVELNTSESTTFAPEASVANSAALRAGDLIWAVGQLDEGVLNAQRVERLATGSPAPGKRASVPTLRQLLVESDDVRAKGDTALVAVGLEFRADRETVLRSRGAGALPQRIHARRVAGGGFRATRVEILGVRPTLDRPVPHLPRESERPAPEPRPDLRPDSLPIPGRPNGVDRPVPPALPPRPARPARPDMPIRPDIPTRPEVPVRPERPEVPPRPEIERFQPINR